MKIWLISLFDPTPMDKSSTGRFIGIAEAAVEKGHEVVHFTSTFRHTSKQQRFAQDQSVAINDKYTIRYLRSMGYTKNMRPKRFYAHYAFAKKMVKELDTLEKPDIIFFSMPPLSTGFEVSKWAKANDIPYVLDVIDPWPDSFIKDVPAALKGVGKLLITPFALKLDRILMYASALTAISSEYVNWALSNTKRENIPNQFYYPAVDFGEVQRALSKHSSREKGEKLRLIYAGSLASSYDIPCILKAAEKVEQRFPGKTQFVIAGVGPQESEIRKYEATLPNLEYVGWQNRDELMEQYYLADVGFIQHKNSLTQTVTYKLFSYLSAGLPVLNSLQSEMVDMINDAQLGMNNKEGDVDTLTENIITYIQNPDLLREHKENALNFTAEHGDTKRVYARLVGFLEKIAAGVNLNIYATEAKG